MLEEMWLKRTLEATRKAFINNLSKGNKKSSTTEKSGNRVYKRALLLHNL